jgi:hypothetical protein
MIKGKKPKLPFRGRQELDSNNSLKGLSANIGLDL